MIHDLATAVDMDAVRAADGTVTVTGAKTGYTTVAKTSAATAKVI